MNPELKKYNFIHREFLNSGLYHSTACVVAKISEIEYGSYPNCEFSISDCSRVITLDMDAYSGADIDNSLYKMDVLIKSAQEMKKALKKLKPYVVAEETKRAKERKEREAKEAKEAKENKND